MLILGGKAALREHIGDAPQAQFCYEIAGAFDLLALFDCESMEEFNSLAEAILSPDATVRRYETSFVKRKVKFEPFVGLKRNDEP